MSFLRRQESSLINPEYELGSPGVPEDDKWEEKDLIGDTIIFLTNKIAP